MGFSSVTGDETIMFADNASFDGTQRGGKMTTNGQLFIGSTASPHVKLGSITSPDGTLTIGYSSPNITLSVAAGGNVVEHLTGDTGGQLNPSANNFNIIGGTAAAGTSPILVAGASSTLTVTAQRSQALAAADSTKVGLSNFNSAHFSVAATGFVSIVTGGMPWTDVTGATQTLAIQNGYLTDRGAGVTYTLPATASLGDVIKIDGKLGLTTIAQNANQAIRMGANISTTGVGGSVAGTNVGDCITLRCSTAGASTIWIAENWVGSWTVT